VDEFEDLVRSLETRFGAVMDLWALPNALVFVNELYERDRLARDHAKHGDLVEGACRLLSRDLASNLRTEDLLAPLHIPYDVIRRYFREATGTPPGRYRERRRLDEACLLLEQGATVAEAARQLGYCDQFAFSDQFRKHVGMSPREFRRRHSA
jgi:AraC-like DNA-binding protein